MSETDELAPVYTSVASAAAYLDCSVSSLMRIVRSGDIECRYMGRTPKVVIASLKAYAGNMPSSPPPRDID